MSFVLDDWTDLSIDFVRDMNWKEGREREKEGRKKSEKGGRGRGEEEGVVGQWRCLFTQCQGADRSHKCPLHSLPCPFSASSSVCGQHVTLPSSLPPPP